MVEEGRGGRGRGSVVQWVVRWPSTTGLWDRFFFPFFFRCFVKSQWVNWSNEVTHFQLTFIFSDYSPLRNERPWRTAKIQEPIRVCVTADSVIQERIFVHQLRCHCESQMMCLCLGSMTNKNRMFIKNNNLILNNLIFIYWNILVFLYELMNKTVNLKVNKLVLSDVYIYIYIYLVLHAARFD